MTGKLISMRIKSGTWALASATPSAPSTAITTSYPLRIRRRDSMSRFISLSSTSRSLVMIEVPPGATSLYQSAKLMGPISLGERARVKPAVFGSQ